MIAEVQDTSDSARALPASAEQAADLRALESLVNEAPAAGPGGAPGASAEPAGPKPPSEAAMAAAGLMVGVLKPLVCYVVPVLKGAPLELWEPIVPGTAGVLDHLGIGSTVLANPWAQLALCAAPLAAYAAMNQPSEEQERPAIAAPSAQAAQAAAVAPAGSARVVIGAAIPAGEGAS